MIPLGGTDFPKASPELADALRAGLHDLVSLPNDQAAVTVGADRLRIDLSGGKMDSPGPHAALADVREIQPGPTFQSLEVMADPLVALGANVYLDLEATDVRFSFGRSRTGRPVMILAAAADGRLTARISRADLETLVTSRLRDAAREKGVEIEHVKFDVTQLGPRSVRLAARAAVQTKALFKTIRGVVTFTGRADVDDRLVARLSELHIVGEGTMIALAVNLVRGKLTAMEGRELPLTTVAVGGVRLRDVQLQVGDEMKVSAAFGEQG